MIPSLNANKHIFLSIFTPLGISLFNFWIYWIYNYNFFVGELLTIETILLFLSTTLKKSKTITLSIYLILTIVCFFLLITNFDKNIFNTSTFESIRIRERQQFYAHEIGKVYTNRIGIFFFDRLGIYFTKFSSNFFIALDLNHYFSPGLQIDHAKYPLFFVPVFVVGFLFFVTNIQIVPVIYCITVLFVSGFTNLDAKINPPLMFPIITLCITRGFLQSLKVVKKFYLK